MNYGFIAFFLKIFRYSFFPNYFLKNLPMLYIKLIVTHNGHTPKRKNVSATFLYHGRFAGIIGQLIPSPSNSLMPQTLIDSFICIDFNYPKK
jgi:hypothetical protein